MTDRRNQQAHKSLRRSDAPHAGASRRAACRWLQLAELLGSASRALRDCLSAHWPPELGPAHCSILWQCCEAGDAGRNQSELAENLAVSPAHVSGLVEDLRQQGLIEAFRPAEDRRRQVWQLTTAGRQQLDMALGAIGEWARQQEQRLGAGSAARIDQLAENLARLVETPAPAVAVASTGSRQGAA